MELTVTGKAFSVDVPEDIPLLGVLRDVIGLTGTNFGCGIAACGACTVHLDGQAVRSCRITTIEAIGASAAGKKIQLHLVTSSECPGSMGEPGTAGTAGALANAVFAATGKRVRRRPIQKALTTV